jgi:hypothetical protein
VLAAAAVLVAATATGGVVDALAGVPALTGVPYAGFKDAAVTSTRGIGAGVNAIITRGEKT